jgi:phage/plasmid-like protein (TIGR03299 family)
VPAEMYEHDTLYSVREAPWHMGTGTSITMLDSAPEARADRMRLAGHNWLVEDEPVYRKGGVEMPGWKILARSDTHQVFSVMADSYGVVQNDTGHEIFELLSKGARLDDGTGGTVKNGAVCYLSARLDEPVMIKGDNSPMFPYVVVTWGHDGSCSVSARSTNVRPVCWNTVTSGELMAIRAGTNYTWRHSKKVIARIEEAFAVISGARQDQAKFVELVNELVDISITDDQREEFVQLFIPAPVTTSVISDRVLDNISEAREKVRTIFTSDTIPEAHRNTAYGLMTAGVEYLDHLRGYRSQATYLGRTLLRDEPMKARLLPLIKELVKA